MTPDLIHLYAVKSFPGAIGVFLGLLIVLSFRAKGGNREGLFKDSVFATAFLASMLTLLGMTFVRLVMHQV